MAGCIKSCIELTIYRKNKIYRDGQIEKDKKWHWLAGKLSLAIVPIFLVGFYLERKEWLCILPGIGLADTSHQSASKWMGEISFALCELTSGYENT